MITERIPVGGVPPTLVVKPNRIHRFSKWAANPMVGGDIPDITTTPMVYPRLGIYQPPPRERTWYQRYPPP